MCRILGFALCLFVADQWTFVSGLSSLDISPPLSQTSWSSGYTGKLYEVIFAAEVLPVNVQWIVSEFTSSAPISFPLSLSDCERNTTMTSQNEYLVTCWEGKQTALNITKPLVSPINITFLVTGVRFKVDLSAQLTIQACNLSQTHATLSSSSTTPCGYNCTAMFTCLEGYTAPSGPTYTAVCNQSGNLVPSNPCTEMEANDGNLPTWLIALIAGLSGVLFVAVISGIACFYTKRCQK
ncbi:unnamed protein product [Clavelina lepadiformis]|uniref:Uncharacterized protein n=1 Tax=Clavelina lepadiformis TaxID=159417 RepID=A0ABP0FG13_CLALP